MIEVCFIARARMSMSARSFARFDECDRLRYYIDAARSESELGAYTLPCGYGLRKNSPMCNDSSGTRRFLEEISDDLFYLHIRFMVIPQADPKEMS